MIQIAAVDIDPKKFYFIIVPEHISAEMFDEMTKYIKERFPCQHMLLPATNFKLFGAEEIPLAVLKELDAVVALHSKTKDQKS